MQFILVAPVKITVEPKFYKLIISLFAGLDSQQLKGNHLERIDKQQKKAFRGRKL